MAKYDLNKMNALLGEIQNNQKRDITFIPVYKIDAFFEHPFKIRNDEGMKILIQSVAEHGILVPLYVRTKENNNFELISGHRRLEAAKQNKMQQVPVIIQECDDETAIILMIDSNFSQRDEILPSEKAFAYKLKLEAIKKRREKHSAHSAHLDKKEKSRDLLAVEENESKDTIRRYIRLTELITPLLDKVDNNELGFIPAVDISYLSKEEQGYVQEVMELAKVKPTKVQADMLKKKSQESGLTREDVKAILVEEKKAKLGGMSATKLKSYFPKEIAKDLTDDRMNEIMQEAIRDWLKKQK